MPGDKFLVVNFMVTFKAQYIETCTESQQSCVSMSLFDPENPQVTTANTLNEIVSFLISVCYQIGILTEQVYSSAIKVIEQNSIKRKRFPVSEKIRIKTNSSKKLPASASKYEIGKNRRSTSQSREQTGPIKSEMSSSSDALATTFPKRRSKHLFPNKSTKLSPSLTTSHLHDLQNCVNEMSPLDSNFQNSPDRRWSFSISGKSDLPRSVSGVRKRRLPTDDSSASSFYNHIDDESYNASKLNLVTFDSTR